MAILGVQFLIHHKQSLDYDHTKCICRHRKTILLSNLANRYILNWPHLLISCLFWFHLFLCLN